MSDIKIIKGEPMPKRKGGFRPLKYPWPDMEVGDHLPAARWKDARRIYLAGHKWKLDNHPDWKFAIRRKADGTYGVWREK